MKNLLVAFCILASFNVWSKEKSLDFSRGRLDSEIKPINVDDLVYRLHITGEIFVLNSEGDKLINIIEEKREWQFNGPREKPIESDWLFQQKGLPLVALKQKWQIENDGKISVYIAQYDSIERGKNSEVNYGKLIKEEKFIIKDFTPIDWIIAAGSKKIVVRLTPGIWPNPDAIDITALPISGKNVVIFDKGGKLWADQVSADSPSVYFGVTTYEGSLFISFVPFKGAKILGEAKGGRMKIKNGNRSIILQSETPFLPKDVKANVYGVIKLDVRSERLNSVRTYTSDKEEEFAKAFNGN